MGLRRFVAMVVLGTLALLGSFALPLQFESRHAQAMDCDAHHGCAPVSPACVSFCMDALKDEASAALALTVPLLFIAAAAALFFAGSVRLAASGLVPVPVRVPTRPFDIRVTRKRLD